MRSKKGISLIVLIITIIVMIILASAIIMSLDNANIFDKAEEAVDKTNVATNKYLSELKLAERELEKIQGASKVTDTNPGELSGKGTTDEPYLIESIEDLVAFSNEVNGGRTFEGETVKLTRLLDFNSDNSYANPTGNDFGDINGDGNPENTLKQELTTGEGFPSIGTGTYGSIQTKPFKGTFDGDGTEIRNIYINLPDESEIVYVGLFGYAEDANFKNIGVTGRIIANNATTGGIAGMIQNVNSETYIENCYSKVEQKGVVMGGVAGWTGGASTEKKIIIQDCYNLGCLSSDFSGPVIGGIIGGAEYYTINRCYNKGNIIGRHELQSGINGGIIGNPYGGEIKNCYNSGKIISVSRGYTGGIVGEGGPMKVENCYNAGEVISKEAAGLFGYMRESNINNCYNIGEMQTLAIILYYSPSNSKSILNKVYYNEQNNLPAIGSGSTNGETPINMTLTQMKSQTFVDTLNKYITDNAREDLVKWKMGPNGYPTLDI